MQSDNDIADVAAKDSYDKYVSLLQAINPELPNNEAQTRYHLIDEIIALLGWDKQLKDVEVEESEDNGGRIDYVLSKLNMPIMVVEAKKANIDFSLISTGKPKTVSIKSLITNNKALHDAVLQASIYSQSKGIAYTAITNGLQFIVFQGSRSDSTSPLDGNAITFGGAKQIEQYFMTFWKALSPESIQLGSLSDMLSNKKKKPPVKISSLLTNYPGSRTRNELQTDLQILSELILEDLTHDELEGKFIDQCYCESGALSQYSLLARNIITSKYYQDTGEETVQLERAKFRDEVNPKLLNDAINHRPVILMGNVGVGKTSFIKNLIYGSSKELFVEENRIPIYVNLGEELVMTDNLNAAIVSAIDKLLKSEENININDKSFVRAVYKTELQDFKTSIYSDLQDNDFKTEEIRYLQTLVDDKQSHLIKSLDHISKNKGAIVIFLDNVDQRSTNDQQNIYLVAQDLAANTNSTVFVSLRPETFYASRDEGVLQAYHQRAFTIEPPRIDEVLSKRLQFGLKISQGTISVPRIKDLGIGKLESLSDLLVVMNRSINRQGSYHNKNLIRFIDNFTSGNVRSAIEMVKDFLSSGHTNSANILHIERETDDEYLISLHEFLKSIVFGENIYYYPEESKINNILEIVGNDVKEYFLRATVLKVLQFLSEREVTNKGFIPSTKLYEAMQELSYDVEQVSSTLQYCLRNHLIETSANYVLRENSSPNLIRITTKAMCYLELLIKQFQYVDAILVDTPIIKKFLMDEIASTYQDPYPDIFIRLKRTALFVDYLDVLYDSTLRQIAPDYINAYWTSVFSALKDEINYIDGKEKRKSEGRMY